jgi:hypothetical protein
MASQDDSETDPAIDRTEFERAGDQQPLGLIAEFWLFLREEKKWWLAPIIIVLLLAAGAVFLSSTGAAPFIYTLF